ncbi:recombinase family protein [Salmonella enterica subsp. enterica serovar Infantis]
MYVNKGDTLVVWKLDRLGRSVKTLVGVIYATRILHERGSHHCRNSLTDSHSIPVCAHAGDICFHVDVSHWPEMVARINCRAIALCRTGCSCS